MASIDIPSKKRGDKLRATEVNAMVECLRSACTMRKLTKAEYDLLAVVEDSCFYLCTGESGEVDYIYLGGLLFAMRESGSEGFPYSFPIVF